MKYHYRPTPDSPTACGEYDPVDDLSTWERGRVTCPKCLAVTETPEQACPHPWWDADDERRKIVCGVCRVEVERPTKDGLATPRQLRDSANGPWPGKETP